MITGFILFFKKLFLKLKSGILSQMWPCRSRLRHQSPPGLMARLGRLPDRAEALLPVPEAGVSGVCTLLPHLPLPHPWSPAPAPLQTPSNSKSIKVQTQQNGWAPSRLHLQPTLSRVLATPEQSLPASPRPATVVSVAPTTSQLEVNF